ncbi:MAG: S8 family serine peptidase [Candidatus Latescibacteria bacterium]|nr:S8 family serine peptidase [Candidatus Latescibacterota bacterium]NIO55400.1 S8 family serine peptidase [Candidatus Latescibacterota bacterium]
MKKLFSAFISFALIISFGLSAFAGEIETNFAAYLETLGDNDFASAIIYLQDRPDIRALDNVLRAEKATMAVRHERVLAALKEAADRSQPAFIAYLDARKAAGTVKGYTKYWIMNLVIVSATKAELKSIAALGDIEMIEGNFKATLIDKVGEAYTGNPAAGIGVTNSLIAINADRVWHELGYTGNGTLVANMDTGVDGSHPALTDRWRGNWYPWQECWRDALGTGTQYPTDTHGHGTHTMGTMCGAGHATEDTVGVAFEAWWIADNSINQGVSPEFDNDVLGAFQWFTDPDGDPGTTDDVPDALQNSWGIDSRFGYDYQDCDYRWQEAIENCEAAGVVVTFSAGNEGPSPQTHRSPANICNTPTVNFSVGAVDCENYGWPYPIAYFSSRGPSDCDGSTIKPEVSAPGVSVYSSYPGGSYVRMSGTSMAGPHVAGVVALMREANPNADVQTIKEILMNTARDLGTTGEDNTYGWGIIDAYEAVLAVSVPDEIPPVVTVTAPNGGEVLTAGTTYTITWIATDNVSVTQTSIYYSYDGGTTYNLIANLAGNPGSYDWTVPNTPSTTCLVQVYAYDAADNEGSDTSDAYFTIEEYTGPYVWVNSINLSIVTKGPNTNATAEVLIWDQDNNPVARATVHSHWDGLTQDTDVFNTKRTGLGSCNSDKLKNPVGWWYYYVDDVVIEGYVFRSDLGETSDAILAGPGTASFSAPIPGEFSVSQNYPNPFNPTTEFSLNLPEDAHVSFVIYNAAGQKVKTLADEDLPAGIRTLTWDGTNEKGVTVPSGIYFYRVISGNNVATRKMMLLK